MTDDDDEIEFDRGVPLPPARREQGISRALRMMHIGDSMRVPGTWKMSSVRQIAYNRFPDRKFAIRKMDPRYPMFRVWRVG
jgi:hypothetical protein